MKKQILLFLAITLTVSLRFTTYVKTILQNSISALFNSKIITELDLPCGKSTCSGLQTRFKMYGLI